ncbi:unnamed protein product [Linum trigynum]|uniref:Uncharacterized protein n=1 Tax=Linum trigynum TaxID=586398 RepID=A0AAV2GLN1_9ROSI
MFATKPASQCPKESWRTPPVPTGPGLPFEEPSMFRVIQPSGGGFHQMLANVRCSAWFLLLGRGSGARQASLRILVLASIEFSRDGGESAALTPLKHVAVQFFQRHQEAMPKKAGQSISVPVNALLRRLPLSHCFVVELKKT